MQQQRDVAAKAQYEAEQEAEKNRRAQERIEQLDIEIAEEAKVVEKVNKEMQDDYNNLKLGVYDKKERLRQIKEALTIPNLDEDEPELYSDLKRLEIELPKVIEEEEKLLKEIKDDPIWEWIL